MDRKVTSLIKKILRRGSLQNPARNIAIKKAQIAPALFKCQNESCEVAIYEGKSEANFQQLKEQHKDLWLLKGKGQVDHIESVREGKGDLDWNDYINTLFCEESNLQYLCEGCHTKKSLRDKENGTK